MSGTPARVAERAVTTRRRRGPAWLRWTLGGWWLVFLFLVVNLRDTFVSDLWPALHDALLALLMLLGSWPLLARIGSGALVALALGGLVWLTILAFRARQEIEEKAAEAAKEAQIEVLHKGNEPVQQQLVQLVELTQQQNELLSQRQPQEALPLPPGVVAPQGLPRPASLVGRAAELDDLMAKLRAGTTMGIFALRGMGGVGKTALAAEAVARLASEPHTFPGGAAWISCENLTGAEGLSDLWARVARALGLEQVAAQPDPQVRRAALAQALAQREQLLLALDNIEPDLDAGAALDTLAVDGHTALLLTARQPVAPQRLASIEIRPLDPPPAAELFAQRLRQVDAARPTAQDEAALPRLLEALGGLPLALELTAAYAGLQRLPLTDVLREVEADGLHAPALRGDPQRALAARFDRSWLKLTARQQRLFAGLSLLEGANFPRVAALALAQATLAKAAPDAVGDLARLVAYTLVEALEGERMRLRPLLRIYAAERLTTLSKAQHERLGDAMVAFWLAYAQAHPGYEGMDDLEAEADGLMGALTWAHEQARHQKVLWLAAALRRFLFVHGHRDEARLVWPWALEAAKALNDPEGERWAAHELAVLNARQGRLAEARAGVERALELARQLGNLAAERSEVQALAALDSMQGRFAEARASFERALELALQLGDLAAEQMEVHELAVLDAKQGRLAEARVGYERALELVWRLGDLAAERVEVHSLAVLDGRTGRLAEARAGFERALELARKLGDPAAERAEVHELAVLDWRTGRLVEARAGYERALALARQLGDLAAEREEVHSLARLDASHKRFAEARAGYERALALARLLGDPAAEREEVHGLAVMDWRMKRPTEAQAGYERARELARQLGDPGAEAAELRYLGILVGQRDEPDQGRKMISEALAINERLKDIYHIGSAHQFLAWLDRDDGNRDAAIAHYREALRCFEQVQSPDAEEVRADLHKLEEGEKPKAVGLILTQEEVERAAQDAAFLAEKLGLAADDPNLLASQGKLRQALAQLQQPPDVEQAAEE